MFSGENSAKNDHRPNKSCTLCKILSLTFGPEYPHEVAGGGFELPWLIEVGGPPRDPPKRYDPGQLIEEILKALNSFKSFSVRFDDS